MNKDTTEELFNRLKGQFDVDVPTAGHQAAFLKRLDEYRGTQKGQKSIFTLIWKPLAVACSLLIMASLTLYSLPSEAKELAEVSPEMAQTQDFFTTTISNELFKIREAVTPETEEIITDAVRRLIILEKDYDQLKKDLVMSGEDKRVIYAMITNFQNRITLLEEVMEQIETIKSLQTQIEPTTL